MHDNDIWKSILGKGIQRVLISEDKTVLVFEVTNNGVQESAAFRVFGDCCSDSWIEHAEGTHLLYNGSSVQTVVERRIIGYFTAELDHIQVYAIQMEIHGRNGARGDFVFEFRNSSNGFYSGYVEPVELKSVENMKFKILKEDF